MNNNKKAINIFWTGGFDSTFRLIQLLLDTQNTVQPHYIVRHENSTGVEIDTMIRIRREIVSKYSEVGCRFLPTIYINEYLIHKYEDIEEQINELKKFGHTREQYHIMANYCEENNIDQIEVSLIKLHEGELESEFFKKFKESKAFKHFTYPIIEFTKKDLLKLAKNKNWHDLLYMTSFCRRPTIKVIPCGLCGPCADAVSCGLGFRLPLKSRIKAYIQIPFRKFWRKNYLKHEKWPFKLIKQKFENKF